MVSVDTMTAPEFQRRGLLSEVGRSTYAHWRDGGVAFVLGLPNERWGSRASALGWIELFPLQWLTRALRPAALLARRLHLPHVMGHEMSGVIEAVGAEVRGYCPGDRVTVRPLDPCNDCPACRAYRTSYHALAVSSASRRTSL